jgi:hypothetical protein
MRCSRYLPGGRYRYRVEPTFLFSYLNACWLWFTPHGFFFP